MLSKAARFIPILFLALVACSTQGQLPAPIAWTGAPPQPGHFSADESRLVMEMKGKDRSGSRPDSYAASIGVDRVQIAWKGITAQRDGQLFQTDGRSRNGRRLVQS